MSHVVLRLLTQPFSLSGPTMQANGDFCRSLLAAKGGLFRVGNNMQADPACLQHARNVWGIRT